jgi:hypothetical protein
MFNIYGQYKYLVEKILVKVEKNILSKCLEFCFITRGGGNTNI